MSATRHICGGEHCGPIDEARCVMVAAIESHLLAYAATLDAPPKSTHVLDLYAHARSIRDDGGEAARWARQVLDLGWRPAIPRPAATKAAPETTEEIAS